MTVAASRKKFVDVARKFFQRKKKLKPTYPSPVLDWQAQRDGYNQLDNNVSLSVWSVCKFSHFTMDNCDISQWITM